MARWGGGGRGVVGDGQRRRRKTKGEKRVKSWGRGGIGRASELIFFLKSSSFVLFLYWQG